MGRPTPLAAPPTGVVNPLGRAAFPPRGAGAPPPGPPALAPARFGATLRFVMVRARPKRRRVAPLLAGRVKRGTVVERLSRNKMAERSGPLPLSADGRGAAAA
ncbi:hypothetical protein GCM10009416_12010 [Craurococcus roseus]|uniref:Uncharacterized protein n=1 Tax=Craurococcus roseus TaxID=77585 RepID=A0ABN1EUR2_9PROT